MLKLKKSKVWEYLLILVLGCFVVFQSYVLYGSTEVNRFFVYGNGDSLRLGGDIIRDFFFWHYGLSGWSFMPRPAFFPNLLAQALVVPWGFSLSLSNLIYSMVMLCFLFIASFLFFSQIGMVFTARKSAITSISYREILIFCLGFFSISLFVVTSSNLLSPLF